MTLAESLALAVMPQNPAKRGDFDAEQQQARRRLALAWHEHHPHEPSGTTLFDQDISGRGRTRLPFLAPHLTDHLLRNAAGETVIDSTLDPRLQGLIERLLHHYINEHRSPGLVNGAVLLVDRRDMSVKARVGSPPIISTPPSRARSTVSLAKRSPGSTLKPFLIT